MRYPRRQTWWGPLVSAVLLLAHGAAPSSSSSGVACPGTPFVLQFHLEGNPAWNAEAAAIFFAAGRMDPDLLVTPTTTRQDICEIETLSVSAVSSRDAVVQAARRGPNAKAVDKHKKKETTRNLSSPKKKKEMYVVIQVRGTPGLQALKTRDVSRNLERLLGAATVTTSIQRGPATLGVLKRGSKQARTDGASLPARTHTLKAYASSPTFKEYTPLIVADADFKGEISLDLVSLANGAVLAQPRCAVTRIYRSPRKANDWTLLTGLEASMFSVKSTARTNVVRLRLSLGQSTYYFRLRGNLNLGKNTETLNKIQAFWSGLGVKLKSATAGSLRTPHQRHLQNTSSSTSDEEESVFHTDNYAAADYATDYAILYKCGKASTVYRFDLSLVPRVMRPDGVTGLFAKPTSTVCLPGTATQGLGKIDQGVPKLSASSAACPAFPLRAGSPSRVLDSPTFDSLHPEEKDWVAQRLLKTAPKLATFLQQNGVTLAPGSRTDLKLAVAVSGGGKRSLFNAAGVMSTLQKANVLDLATWVAGASGGSWLLGGLYGASLGKEGLVDPATFVNARMADLTKSVFDATFRANDVLTNFGVNGVASLPVAPFAPQASAAAATESILCQAELKFQSPAVKSSQAGNPAMLEYWSRALGYQLLGPASQDGGIGLMFSGLVNDPLLANQKAPLPLVLLQNNNAGGTPGQYRLFEVSPFDVGVHKGDLHVSYPTALLGTDATDAAKRCTTQFDQLAWLMGTSGWIFPMAQKYYDGTLQSIICGEGGSACQPLLMNNPFYGHTGPSRQVPAHADLFTAGETRMVDGGFSQNNPVWGFVTPTRQADVVLVIDSSGWEDAPVSTSPAATCSSDTAASCVSGTYYDTATDCCSTCSPLLDFGCWPTSDPELNDLFKLSSYSAEHTLPTDLPKPGDAVDPKWLTQVSFFGCREPAKTAIVYVPNRMVTSGKSGFTAVRSVIELNQMFGVPADPLTAKDVQDILKNGQDQLGASDLKGCLACLFAASLPGQDRPTFWQGTPQCSACLDQYCQA